MKVIEIRDRETGKLLKSTLIDRPDWQIDKIVLAVMVHIDLKRKEIVVKEYKDKE